MSKDFMHEINSTAFVDDESQVDDDGVVAAPIPDNCVRMDGWSQRRGRNYLRYVDAEKERETKDMVATAKKLLPEHQREAMAADFLALAWEPQPMLNEKSTDMDRMDFIRGLMDSPEYESLHRDTMFDDMASEVAAGHLQQQYIKMVEERVKNAKDGKEKDDLDREADDFSAAKKAMGKAKESVDEIKDARESMGMGKCDARSGPMDMARLRHLFGTMKDSGQLRRIMKLAGRYRSLAQSKQASKTIHGEDDTIEIVFGDDIAKVLTSELALLCDDDLDLEFCRKFAERQLQIRELATPVKEERGPIVVVVDESGSMHGSHVENAKAMALAMAWIAKNQKRYCCLVSYSGGKKPKYLVIKPGEAKDEELITWLSGFLNGGSDIDLPIEELPQDWDGLGCPKGKTDVIMITDARCNLPERLTKRFKAWKEAEKVRAHFIVLGCHKCDSLNNVADTIKYIDEISVEDEAIGEVLSV